MVATSDNSPVAVITHGAVGQRNGTTANIYPRAVVSTYGAVGQRNISVVHKTENPVAAVSTYGAVGQRNTGLINMNP